MKKIIAVITLCVLMLTMGSCARKVRPVINIKHESVTTVTFKRTVFSTDNPITRDYMQKTVTEANDVEQLLDWIESLDLKKHEAIEVPTEKIEYVILLGDTKQHTLVFFENYAVYDSTAYTFNTPAQKDSVSEKYNMLNYKETETELDLI